MLGQELWGWERPGEDVGPVLSFTDRKLDDSYGSASTTVGAGPPVSTPRALTHMCATGTFLGWPGNPSTIEG